MINMISTIFILYKKAPEKCYIHFSGAFSLFAINYLSNTLVKTEKSVCVLYTIQSITCFLVMEHQLFYYAYTIILIKMDVSLQTE